MAAQVCVADPPRSMLRDRRFWMVVITEFERNGLTQDLSAAPGTESERLARAVRVIASTTPVQLVGRDDVMDKLVYTATNPVKDGLVDRSTTGPGSTGYALC